MNEPIDSASGERDPTMGEIADLAMRRMATAIVVAGAAIALAIYARPAPARYQAFPTEAGFIRIDTRNGKMIACERNQCMTVLERGQLLAPNPNKRKLRISLPKQ